jgi:flagellin
MRNFCRLNDVELSSLRRRRSAVSLGVLNNLSAVYAETYLNKAYAGVATSLEELSTGSRINSGADDPAGISMVDGMNATLAGLQQTAADETVGEGRFEVADGALSQVSTLLERAMTLATEASNDTLNSAQKATANVAYQSILAEISNIATTTSYNQTDIFGAGIVGLGEQTSVITSNSTAVGISVEGLNIAGSKEAGSAESGTQSASTNNVTQDVTALIDHQQADLSNTDLLSSSDAQNAMRQISAAIGDVSEQDGGAGTSGNTGGSEFEQINTEIADLTAGLNAIQATDFAQATSSLAKFEMMVQTSLAALSQANTVEKEVLQTVQQPADGAA